MKKIVFATTNQLKLDMARYVLEPLGFEVIGKKLKKLPEIQADTISEVAIYSSQYAHRELKCAILKNDSGLVIPALNGFPSLYSNYVEKTLGEDGILRLMEGIDDRKAYFLDVLAYTDEEGNTKTFESKSWGTISKNKEGNMGIGYDFIFIPDGQEHTLACFTDEEKLPLFNCDAYSKLGEWLKEK